jgi:hypothetical protein
VVPNPFILIRREKLLKPLKWSTPTPACLAFAFVPVAAGSSIERAAGSRSGNEERAGSRSRYGRNARSGIGSAPSFATRTAAGIYAESTGSTAYTAT